MLPLNHHQRVFRLQVSLSQVGSLKEIILIRSGPPHHLLY